MLLVLINFIQNKILIAIEEDETDIRPDIKIEEDGGVRTRVDWKSGKVDFEDIVEKSRLYIDSTHPSVLMVYLDIGLVLRIREKKIVVESYWKELDSQKKSRQISGV